jgi:hypothetical protein
MERDDQEQQDAPRESEPNPTQERMDEKGGGDRPVDASWTDDEGEPATP